MCKTPVKHMFHTCNICVYPTYLLHMYNKCIIRWISYTCITCVEHAYYTCMYLLCITGVAQPDITIKININQNSKQVIREPVIILDEGERRTF